MRRCVCAGLVLALFLPLSPAGAIAGFGDVAEGRYFSDPVQWSVDNGITGIVGNCFMPDEPVSRGETAVWMWRMQDRPEAEQHDFTDVSDAEQDLAVSWMLNVGVTTGTSPTTFSPDDTLTRGQIAAFLWRLEGKPAADPHPFVDVTTVWQQIPVSWMATSEITTGTTRTTFSPASTLTRAQLVTFLYRYKNSPPVEINSHTPTCDPDAPDDDLWDGDDLEPGGESGVGASLSGSSAPFAADDESERTRP